MKEVLVFVDEPSTLRDVLRVLNAQTQWYVHTLKTSADVLNRTNPKSVVLTDLLPTDVNGLDFLQSLQHREGGLSTPVIVLTSAKNEQLAAQALRCGATSYVPSHLVSSELVDTLKNVFAVSSARHERSRVMEYMHHWSGKFLLENDRTLIAPLVRYLQDATQQMGLLTESGEETRLGIALEEALLNGMYHGNLEVPSSIREENDAKFYALIEKRRHEVPYCHRVLRVEAHFDRDVGEFLIQDEGPGFDVSTVPDPTDPLNIERVCGRGMLLMRTFMDDVKYNDVGNQVRLWKRRKSKNPS